MKRSIVILAAVLAISATTVKAQSPVHIGFIYPLSTNGIKAGEITNTVSVHAIAGVSAGEQAVCVSGVSNLVKQDADGVIAAGLTNVILGNANGAQLAGFLNIVRHNAAGAQVAGFMNYTGSGCGIQTAGFANISGGAVGGAQLSGFINTASNVAMQGAGFINIAHNVEGAQVAGFINKAADVNSQVAGFINIAKHVKGIQAAGFINIAESSDYPIGIINIVKTGSKYIGLTVDENMTTMAAFRSGGRVTYGIIGGGINLREQDEPLVAMEAGIGMHVPIARRIKINMEVTLTTLTDFYETANYKSSLRVLPAVSLGDRIELFAGPTFNFITYDYWSTKNFDNNYLWSENGWGHFKGLSIGGVAGLQFKL